MEATPSSPSGSFLSRHEFLIRRLHSLSGLVPVGAYMVIHLLTNASVLDSSAAFQKAVYQIHSLGNLLPVVEWVFIFIPLLFHAIFGVVIIRGGLPNHSSYQHGSNIRYSLQRATGMIAFVFIFWHVFHMHGWFHFEGWLKNVAEPLGGAKFRPYNAASTLGQAMGGVAVPLLYAIGVLSCVFHLANGIWTAGITWGVWISPRAQQWSLKVCAGFGVLLAFVALSAIWGASSLDVDKAKQVEDAMYKARIEAREIEPNDHKRSGHEHDEKTISATEQ